MTEQLLDVCANDGVQDLIQSVIVPDPSLCKNIWECCLAPMLMKRRQKGKNKAHHRDGVKTLPKSAEWESPNSPRQPLVHSQLKSWCSQGCPTMTPLATTHSMGMLARCARHWSPPPAGLLV